MRKTKNLTFCSIMVALSVVLLFICSFLESLNLTAVLLSSICVFVVDEELHMKRALGVYLATGILAFLLLPSKLIAIEYFIYALYPVLKRQIGKTGRGVSIILKGIYIMAATVGDLAVIKLFFPSEIESQLLYILSGVVGVIWIILYDLFYSRLARLYHFKLRHQLRIDKFFD